MITSREKFLQQVEDPLKKVRLSWVLYTSHFTNSFLIDWQLFENKLQILKMHESSEADAPKMMSSLLNELNFQNVIPYIPGSISDYLKSKNIIIHQFNVSGTLFDVPDFLLANHPDTLLGNKQKRQKYYDRNRNQFFLDRHRLSFESILKYYHTGFLRRNDEIPIDIFLEELAFYKIERKSVSDYLVEDGLITASDVRIRDEEEDHG